MSKVVAIIPARSGSKRLPNKNIMELDGRPLLAYSILIARSTPAIDEVWVTTDSPEYAVIASEWGAQIIMRPPELAADNTSTLDTLRHALQEVEADWVVLLQPNCALRRVEDVESAVVHTLMYYSDGLLSVQLGPFKIGTVSAVHAGTFMAAPYWRPKYRFGSRKQDMGKEWREDGNIYVLNGKNIRDKKRLHGRKMGIRESRMEQSAANIDTQFDFDLTTYLYHQYGYHQMFAELESNLKVEING